MKVVLDTNILVSGLLQPLGPSGRILRRAVVGELILCHDDRILAEYREVLLRQKFRFDPERVEILLEGIQADGIVVKARPLATSLPDPDDEAFLEVALAGRAECLVTGNAKHYPSEARSGMEVLSPRLFLDLYPEPESDDLT